MAYIIEDRVLQKIKVEAGTILIKEGEISRKMFFIKSGCVRLWFNNNGKEVCTQFFFEEEMVVSLESYLDNQPSPFTIETMETCELEVLGKKEFEKIIEKDQRFKEWFYETAVRKLISHSKRLVSFIKSKPEERYAELIKQQPFIVNRLPIHYISTYLGVSPVSFGRIRKIK